MNYRLAEIAYRAYCAASDNISVHGSQLPSFENLPDLTKQHWQAAGLAAQKSNSRSSAVITTVIVCLLIFLAACFLGVVHV